MEHKIRYKNDTNTEKYRSVLKQCANDITAVEGKMQNIRTEVFDGTVSKECAKNTGTETTICKLR